MQEQRGPRPFDATTRRLIENEPEAWLRYAGLPVNGPVHPLDSDLSTVLAEVDKVLWVDAPSPWIAHLELQTSRDYELPVRLLQYHALLLRRHRVPVASVVILLRSDADGRELRAPFEQPGPTGEPAVTFRFGVVRVWEQSVEALLQGGIGTLPLVPLANVGPEQLPAVIRQLDARIEQEAAPDLARSLGGDVHPDGLAV